VDLRGAMPGIRAPTLVVSAAQDLAIPPDHGERLAATIPGARLEILQHAAHLPHAEHPAALARLILNHLGDAAPARQ